MANYAQDMKQYHQERIREVLALNPRASVRAIYKLLESHPQSPLKLSHPYILKLRHKIEGEREHRFDHAAVEKHLATIQDRLETVVSQMWLLLLDEKTDGKVRVAAANTIIKADMDLWQAFLDGGVFERKLGTIDINARLRNRPIPEEVKSIMLKALKAHLGPGADTPKQIEAKVIEAETAPSNNATIITTIQPTPSDAPREPATLG